MNEELQFNRIYEKTKDFGRTQFVREIQMQINDNKRLQQENKQLKEQLLVAQTNEETYRLEMQEITKILGLSEDSLFDDVKKYARKLENQQKELIKYLENMLDNENDMFSVVRVKDVLSKYKSIIGGKDEDI